MYFTPSGFVPAKGSADIVASALPILEDSFSCPMSQVLLEGSQKMADGT
jgi:hypothetical protein